MALSAWNGADLIGINSVLMREEQFSKWVELVQVNLGWKYCAEYACSISLYQFLKLYNVLNILTTSVQWSCWMWKPLANSFFFKFWMFLQLGKFISANLLVCLKPISTPGMDVLGSRCLNFRPQQKHTHTHTDTHAGLELFLHQLFLVWHIDIDLQANYELPPLEFYRNMINIIILFVQPSKGGRWFIAI